MTTRFEEMRARLKSFDFQNLFIEDLGWDHFQQRLEVQVDGRTYILSAIAEKRGLAAFHLPVTEGAIPDHAERRKIDNKVTKSVTPIPRWNRNSAQQCL